MQLQVPKHLVIAEGRVYPQSASCVRNYTPKVIDYRHTIRVVSAFDCGHGEIEAKSQQLRAELGEKEREIERLREEVRIKTDQIQKKDQEILRLKEEARREVSQCMVVSRMDQKMQKSQVTDIFSSNIQPNPDGFQSRNIKTSFIFDMSSSQCFQPAKQFPQQSTSNDSKIDEEFANIQKTLSDLATTLTKPKRKYEFFTRKPEAQPKVDVLPVLPDKLKLNLQSLRFKPRPEILTTRSEEEIEEVFDDESMDHTSTDESLDTTNFLEEAISDHRILKEALIELEQSTRQQMQQMRQYYEGQLEAYRRMLEAQRDKASPTTLWSELRGVDDQKQAEHYFSELLYGSRLLTDQPGYILDND